MQSHYTLESLKRALDNPILFAREVVRLASWPIHNAYGAHTRSKYGEGIDVMTADWDNLILLDACRYDYFEKINHLDGDLRKEISRGKKSWEFIENSFLGRNLHDTVYVTANPFSTDVPEGTFFHVEHLHADRWDDRIGTVQPQDVIDGALEVHERYPNKRLVVHFMQPHRPHIGPTADRLRDRVDLQGYGDHDEGIQIWGAVKQRDVSIEEVRQAYAESVEIVLQHVATLLEALCGKSVITSDHGEMLGERIYPFTTRVWGHMEGFDTPTLREVPWLVAEGDRRRDVSADDPIGSQTDLGDTDISERLAALGYAD